MSKLNGRVALVTGASSGIGKGICVSLVEQGMIVVGAARRLELMQEMEVSLVGKKGKFVPYKCDITKDEEVHTLFSYIKQHFGSLHVCVNNAGKGVGKPLLETDTKEWRDIMDLNVIALTLCTKLSVLLMRELGIDDGYIINISSMAAHAVNDFPEIHFYTASKFAVRALTEAFRQEFKALKSGIRISSLSPGYVKTAVFAGFQPNPMQLKAFENAIPMETSDIGDLVVYLLSSPSRVEINDVKVSPTKEVSYD